MSPSHDSSHQAVLIYQKGPTVHENPHCPVHVMHRLVSAHLASKLPLSGTVLHCNTCSQLRAEAGIDLLPIWERTPDFDGPYEGLVTVSTELTLLHANCYAFRLMRDSLLREVNHLQSIMETVALALASDSGAHSSATNPTPADKKALAVMLLDAVKESKGVLTAELRVSPV